MTARIFRAIFKGAEGGLEEIREEGFVDEKSMQTLIGENLGVIFPNYELVKHEFLLENKKIDTVAFNTKAKSFVLIEYKKSKVRGVLEQAISYLRLLDKREADFLQLYRESCGISFNKKDIAWDKNKAIIISPSFTEHQLSMAKESKEPIELYQISKYKNGIMTFGRVAHQEQIIRPPSDEEKHLAKASDKTKNVYNKLKSELVETMPDLKIVPMKIVIKILNKYSKMICTIEVLQNSLNLSYTTDQLSIKHNDRFFVKNMVRPKIIGNHGSGDYMSKIGSEEDVTKAIHYVRQVYDKKSEKATSEQGRSTTMPSGQHSEEEYLKKHGSDATKALYKELQDRLSIIIPGIKTKATKRYIGWRSPINGKLFCAVEILKESLKIIYNTEELNVLENDTKIVEHVTKNGNEVNMVAPGNYRSKITNEEELTRILPYIKNVHMQKMK